MAETGRLSWSQCDAMDCKFARFCKTAWGMVIGCRPGTANYQHDVRAFRFQGAADRLWGSFDSDGWLTGVPSWCWRSCLGRLAII
jgi:hypothetical protein